jgi:hypothetical protein
MPIDPGHRDVSKFEEMHRDEACRLEQDPGRAGHGRQDLDNWRSDVINIINYYFKFKAVISIQTMFIS